MFGEKKRQLIVEESDVTTVLTVVNKSRGFFSNTDTLTGNCGFEHDPKKWYVRFWANDREWGRIATELSKTGRIYVSIDQRGGTDLYYTRLSP